MFQTIFKKRTDVYLKKFQHKNIILTSNGANFFGQESLGRTQIRGNGLLLLTSDELFFGMWLPKREYLIPLVSIHELESPKSFFGRTKFRPLLKIVFTNDSGETDSCAWLVRDVKLWSKRIEEYVESKKK